MILPEHCDQAALEEVAEWVGIEPEMLFVNPLGSPPGRKVPDCLEPVLAILISAGVFLFLVISYARAPQQVTLSSPSSIQGVEVTVARPLGRPGIAVEEWYPNPTSSSTPLTSSGTLDTHVYSVANGVNKVSK